MYELRIKGRFGGAEARSVQLLACWSGHCGPAAFLLEHSHTGGLLWANCTENPAENTLMTHQKQTKKKTHSEENARREDESDSLS